MGATPTAIEVCFGPFRLDPGNARLLRDGRPVALTPKAFDLLHHLAGRPQRLVTKKELLEAVWPDVIVSDASVKVCVREIRKALDDGARTPTYIETVHRRGYRFIGAVEVLEPPGEVASPRTSPETARAPIHPQPSLVGRDDEWRRLGEYFRAALERHRQCVFLAGAPGSGKTALAEAFVRSAGGGRATALSGHCFQQFGTSEPYMPLWEALGRLSRERPSPLLEGLLARHAAAHAPVTVAPSPPGPS